MAFDIWWINFNLLLLTFVDFQNPNQSLKIDKNIGSRTNFLISDLTIHTLRQQKDWVGGFKKWQFLLTFITVFKLRYWVGGSQKGQKYADVIYGSLAKLLTYLKSPIANYFVIVK